MMSKEFRKYQEDTSLKINKCKRGKVISIKEGKTKNTIKKTIRKSGHLIPDSYEQTVVVPQYYVKLDNGITLVSKDANLKINSVIGKTPKPEFCSEELIHQN